jgi:hypothetical protein
MRVFTIDCDNNIAVYAAPEEVPAGDKIHRFTSEKDLGKVLEMLNGDELVQLWNSFAGVTPFDDLKPVKKFTDRKTAVARIWKAVQRLDAPKAANVAQQGAPISNEAAPKAKRSGKKATSPKKAARAKQGATEARDGSKKAEVLELLRRKQGATLAEIMKTTGWQAHTVRGFVSGTLTKKLGLKVESFRTEDKERTYRVSA